MKRIIKREDAEFLTTPRKGWLENEFFLISAGGDLKRVWTRDDPGLPRFALDKGGIAAENQAIIAWVNVKTEAEAIATAKRLCELLTEESVNAKYLFQARRYLADK